MARKRQPLTNPAAGDVSRDLSGASLVRETSPGWSVEVAERGRLVLPAPLRKQMALEAGDRLMLSLSDDGSLRVRRLADVVRHLQGAYRTLAPRQRLSDQLLAQRRDDARREDAE